MIILKRTSSTNNIPTTIKEQLYQTSRTRKQLDPVNWVDHCRRVILTLLGTLFTQMSISIVLHGPALIYTTSTNIIISHLLRKLGGARRGSAWSGAVRFSSCLTHHVCTNGTGTPDWRFVAPGPNKFLSLHIYTPPVCSQSYTPTVLESSFFRKVNFCSFRRIYFRSFHRINYCSQFYFV